MREKQSLPEKIEESIIRLIREGLYRPGDKLPNELELSAELNISRATLREALKVLDSKNIIEIRRGIGTFIANHPGVGESPLGLRFINVKLHTQDVLEIEKTIGVSLMLKLPHESYDNREALLADLSSVEDKDVLIRLNSVLMKMADALNCDYYYRLLKAQTEALTLLEVDVKEIENWYIKWLKELQEKEIESAIKTYETLIAVIEV